MTLDQMIELTEAEQIDFETEASIERIEDAAAQAQASIDRLAQSLADMLPDGGDR